MRGNGNSECMKQPRAPCCFGAPRAPSEVTVPEFEGWESLAETPVHLLIDLAA
jgi:hypothetical protein